MDKQPLGPMPDHIKVLMRELVRAGAVDYKVLDSYDLELFEWYLAEEEAVIERMAAEEHSYIAEQVAHNVENVNDSGIVAVDYYSTRVRYGHVIQLTSLLESCLERACENLLMLIGDNNVPFGLNEIRGDQWTKRRDFLERYGRFDLPDSLWKDTLAPLITLRNYIVHENGRTTKLQSEGGRAKQDRAVLSTLVGVDSNGLQVLVKVEYVRSALSAVKEYVRAVESGLGEVSTRVRKPTPV